MTLVQIAMMFFEKSENVFQVPMKGVRKLVNGGYLRAVQLRIGEKRLYVTTPQGVRYLRKKKLPGGSLRLPRKKKMVNDKTWEHDEEVTNARIAFQTLLGFEEWTPERVLKKKAGRGKVPDGIASDGESRFAVEVETNLKNKTYYKRVFQDLYIQYHGLDAILYVMKNETDMKWLMKQAKRWDHIYFALLKDLMEMRDGVTFHNADGRPLYLERAYRGSVLFPGFKWEGVDLRDIPEEELDEFQKGQLECEQFARQEEEERTKKRRDQGDNKNAA